MSLDVVCHFFAHLVFCAHAVPRLCSQTANLRLGLPVIVEHTVTPSSPLFDLSLAEMERRGMEIM